MHKQASIHLAISKFGELQISSLLVWIALFTQYVL